MQSWSQVQCTDCFCATKARVECSLSVVVLDSSIVSCETELPVKGWHTRQDKHCRWYLPLTGKTMYTVISLLKLSLFSATYAHVASLHPLFVAMCHMQRTHRNTDSFVLVWTRVGTKRIQLHIYLLSTLILVCINWQATKLMTIQVLWPVHNQSSIPSYT